MNLNQILSGLRSLTEDDLVSLNRAVCDQIKASRNADAALKRHLFAAGDSVKWIGRKGPQAGEIVKVNRKKAVVKVGFVNWNVPLNMLEAS